MGYSVGFPDPDPLQNEVEFQANQESRPLNRIQKEVYKEILL